jgi:hypothetical protein
MYHPTSIAPLSQSQISKALKGLPVRISPGNQHDIELSADQFKKFSKEDGDRMVKVIRDIGKLKDD